VFGEVDYRFADHWTATVGLRWFHSYRSDEQVLVQQFFPGAPVGAQPFQDFRETHTFKKFQLTREISPDWLVYVEAAEGFRAGGPNYPGGFALTAPPYAADSIWNYEFGWKAALADRRVEWTGALFRIDWTHVQQLLPVQIFSAIVNGGNARAEGFETELLAYLTRSLTFNAGVSFSDAHLAGAQPLVTNPASQLQPGDELGGVPQWTANAAVNYVHFIGDGLRVRGRLDQSFLSSRANIAAARNPGYFRIDDANLTSLSLAIEREKTWTASLRIYNLLNDFVPLSGKTSDGNLIRTITAARPRTVSLNLELQFR
jgi:outer membrane receptor protein involved in Fe transport